MPDSPRKRQAILKTIVADEFPQIIPNTIPKNATGKQLSEETKEKVKLFFLQDEHSQPMPGKRDVLSIKDEVTGIRTVHQKRCMFMTVGEAYNLFKQENKDCSIKKSKFYELRPKYVLPVSEMPHNVCVCKYHINMDFLVKSLHNIEKSFPNNGKILVDMLVCSSNSEICMKNKCDNCITNNLSTGLKNLFKQDQMTIDISWKQWTDSEEKLKLVEVKGSVHDCIKEIEKQFIYYKWHLFIKRSQAAYFEETKDKLKDGEAVLQVDFAENFTATSQDEIQSAHWVHQQITIFTAVAWMSGEEKQCFAVISDELGHGKLSVWVFLKTIITSLLQKYKINTLKIFSDGCAAQFKNKFTLSNLIFAKEDFGIPIVQWSFFASSHGKGAVDGVGATVKRAVWTTVKARRCIVSTAEEFAKCAESQLKGIKIILVTKEEIKKYEDFLTARWKTVCPIPKLQTIHHLEVSKEEPDKLLVASTSKSLFTIVSPHKRNAERSRGIANRNKQQMPGKIKGADIAVGDFVQVSFSASSNSRKKSNFFAVVTEVFKDRSEVTVSYMKKSGTYWIWPKEKETSCVKLESTTKVTPPNVVNNHGLLKFYF